MGCCPLTVPLLSYKFTSYRLSASQVVRLIGLFTLEQALHADLKLQVVPRAKTFWASDISRAFEGLRGCDTYTQAFLQGLPICYSDFTADMRFRMRKVWRDTADMNPLESDNELVTHKSSWFAKWLLVLHFIQPSLSC